MTKRHVAIVALIAATIILFLNRNTFSLQHIEFPVYTVAIVLWITIRLGWIQAGVKVVKAVGVAAPEKEFQGQPSLLLELPAYGETFSTTPISRCILLTLAQ